MSNEKISLAELEKRTTWSGDVDILEVLALIRAVRAAKDVATHPHTCICVLCEALAAFDFDTEPKV